MKRIVFSIIVVLLSNAVWAQDITFRINSGKVGPTLQEKIEANVSALLTAINRTPEKEVPDLSSVMIDEGAAKGLIMRWQHGPFRCEEPEVEEKLLSLGDMYQIRNIPIMRKDLNREEAYEELILDIDGNGCIYRVNKAVGKDIYESIMSGGVEDETRKSIILDFVEQFRTAYDEKDLDFLEKVFSDDALIITGKVVQRRHSERGVSLKPEIQYNKLSKPQYMKRLDQVFRSTEYIKVNFRDIEVIKHPTDSVIFGVRLRQDYKSLFTSGIPYEDDGYLFLVWDFKDENRPQILVRTWQPYWLDEKKKTQHIDKKDIIGLDSFTY